MKSIVRRDAVNIVYEMVVSAHEQGKLLSRKEIEKRLTEDPNYDLAKSTVSEILKEMRVKHLIVLRVSGNRHYYGLPWLTTPYWLATIFSTIVFFCAVVFLLSYKWYSTLQFYYFEKGNNVFVNHHILTLVFIIVIVFNNFIFAFFWSRYNTKKLHRRKEFFIKK